MMQSILLLSTYRGVLIPLSSLDEGALPCIFDSNEAASLHTSAGLITLIGNNY